MNLRLIFGEDGLIRDVRFSVKLYYPQINKQNSLEVNLVSIEYHEAVCWFLHNKFIIYLDGIRAEGCCGGADVRLDMDVTHWMPLPPAPDAE